MFTVVAIVMALCMAGCGCLAATPPTSPTWQQLQSARSPSLCGQKPTKLVKGEHTAIPRGGGHFRLVKKLYSGNSG
ncbi:exported hypothetical protein [Candidatus Microthrix parvicella RN1]|uniref:Secreted protein n=1 Tax=Candidatus Neomicrothrix parvicella RN1 TaxID=1229780 RepID=R4Z6U5_9ACTN|nr:exported hypothetical protein [Candidatus Microthrix parvicella RN1]